MGAEEEQPIWYVRRSTTVQGPYRVRDIQRYLLLGRLRLSDRVSVDARCWEQLTQRPELIPDEMRDLGTEAGRARFEAARRAVDERRFDRDTQPDIPLVGEAVASSLRWRRSLAGLAGLMILIMVLVTVGWYRDFDSGLIRQADCDRELDGDVTWSGCVKDGLELTNGAGLAGIRALNVSLRDAALPGADLSGARLDYADLTRARLRDADLRGAVLRGATLGEAVLAGADLRRADLRDADLRDADIEGARFEGAMLGNALWVDGSSCVADAVGACNP